MVDKIILATTGKSPADKVDFWADSLAQLCGQLYVDPYGAETIDGLIEYGCIGPFKLCQIEATKHRVGLPREGARPDKPPVVKILFQTEGISTFEQGDQRVVISPGDCFAYDVSRPHLISNTSSTKHLVFIIPKDVAVAHGFRLSHVPAQNFSAHDGVGRVASDFVRSTFSQMETITPDCEADLADSILRLLYMLLQGPAARAALPPTELLKEQVKMYIRRNLRDPELSIEQIADAMKYTKRYLHMAFANERTTIARYIWNERLTRCHRELEQVRDRKRTITDIAYSWGFNSSSHFSRMFRDKFGVSPSAFLRDGPDRQRRKK